MKNAGLPKKTPLHSEHLERNGRMVVFENWLLPVQYSSILKEHLHTREKNSIFDISHMGEFLLEGKSAESDLSRILSCRVDKIKDGRCKYCFILNKDGCFIDDAVLFRFSSERFMLVVNAGRTSIDYNWIKSGITENTLLKDISPETAKIDLQGPLSPGSASKVFGDQLFLSMPRFSCRMFRYNDIEIIVGATGYTGEKGFEFFIPSSAASEIWNKFLELPDIQPAGLGARDSLRLEKGYSLYGHELSESINPFEAGLGRFINTELDFTGSEKLREITKKKISRQIVPFLCEGRRSARDGYIVYSGNTKIGYVTSGAYSPSIKQGIGLCMVDAEFTERGTDIICISDDIKINAVVSELPFV